jgi:hypothetical protein
MAEWACPCWNRRASTFRWRSSERAIRRQGQRRYPGLGGGLGAVRAATGARGCAQRGLHRPGRRRILGHVVLRRADPDAEHRQDRRRWPPVHPVAHHSLVLAHQILSADRAEPHPQQHGLYYGGLQRVRQRQRHDPARERHAAGDPGRAGLEHLHGRQVAPVPHRRDEPRLDPAGEVSSGGTGSWAPRRASGIPS